MATVTELTKEPLKKKAKTEIDAAEVFEEPKVKHKDNTENKEIEAVGDTLEGEKDSNQENEASSKESSNRNGRVKARSKKMLTNDDGDRIFHLSRNKRVTVKLLNNSTPLVDIRQFYEKGEKQLPVCINSPFNVT